MHQLVFIPPLEGAGFEERNKGCCSTTIEESMMLESERRLLRTRTQGLDSFLLNWAMVPFSSNNVILLLLLSSSCSFWKLPQSLSSPSGSAKNAVSFDVVSETSRRVLSRQELSAVSCSTPVQCSATSHLSDRHGCTFLPTAESFGW